MSNDEFVMLKRRAQALLDVGRYREALPFLRQAHGLEPEQSEIPCMLSYAYVSLEEYREALEWANKAAGMAPEEEWGHRLRSVIFMRTNKPKRALEAALEAAQLSPDGLFTLSNLTEAQVCNHRMREAEATVERLLAVAPEDGLAHRTRAYVFLYRKKYEDAERSCRLALRLEPENARALRLLGDSLRGQKLLRGAVENYAESLRLAPTNAETRKALQETAMDYLGWPWGPQIVGLLVAFGLMALKVESRAAMGLGALAVWGYGWATARHGLQELWADNPKFTALPAPTQAILVDVCRTETTNYLRAAVWRYSLCCLAILFFILIFLLWRGD